MKDEKTQIPRIESSIVENVIIGTLVGFVIVVLLISTTSFAPQEVKNNPINYSDVNPYNNQDIPKNIESGIRNTGGVDSSKKTEITKPKPKFRSIGSISGFKKQFSEFTFQKGEDTYDGYEKWVGTLGMVLIEITGNDDELAQASLGIIFDLSGQYPNIGSMTKWGPFLEYFGAYDKLGILTDNFINIVTDPTTYITNSFSKNTITYSVLYEPTNQIMLVTAKSSW